MQRHFSNRGEALAEVTAARALAHRTLPARSTWITKSGRRGTTEQWFTRLMGTTQRPERNDQIETGTSRRVL